jgi:hypothetical protein
MMLRKVPSCHIHSLEENFSFYGGQWEIGACVVLMSTKVLKREVCPSEGSSLPTRFEQHVLWGVSPAPSQCQMLCASEGLTVLFQAQELLLKWLLLRSAKLPVILHFCLNYFFYTGEPWSV